MLGWNRRMYIDRLQYLRKSGMTDLDLVHAKWQPFQRQCSLLVRAQSSPILVRLTRDLNRGFHRQSRRIRHPKPQLARVALANERQAITKETNQHSPRKYSNSIGQNRCPNHAELVTTVHPTIPSHTLLFTICWSSRSECPSKKTGAKTAGSRCIKCDQICLCHYMKPCL